MKRTTRAVSHALRQRSKALVFKLQPLHANHPNPSCDSKPNVTPAQLPPKLGPQPQRDHASVSARTSLVLAPARAAPLQLVRDVRSPRLSHKPVDDRVEVNLLAGLQHLREHALDTAPLEADLADV